MFKPTKFLSYVAVLALMCVSAACQKEPSAGALAGDQNVKITVAIPAQVQTKAVSEADNTDIVYYEVWDEAFTTRLFPVNASDQNYGTVQDCVAELDIALVKDQTYNMIFWAQNKDCGAYSWTDLKNVNVDYSKFTANVKDVYDAFYAWEEITADGQDKTVRLHRPFAQLNFGASRMDTNLGAIELASNQVTFSDVATSFNTVAGKANAGSYVKDVTLEASDGGLVQALKQDRKDLEVGADSYYWVAMNYILVPSDDKATVEVNAVFETTRGDKVTHKLQNVPLKKNYRTNIVGDLFTSSSHLSIIVEPVFNKPDYDNDDHLAQVLANGGEYTLIKDMTIDPESPVHISNAVTINLNGFTLTYPQDDILARVDNGGVFTITGPGKVLATGYVASANVGGKVNVNGGDYQSASSCLFQANGGEVTVTAGVFEAQPYEGRYYTLNHIDAQKDNGRITVSGGRFYKFNPAASESESPAMNFLAPGYKTITDGEWFTVVKE